MNYDCIIVGGGIAGLQAAIQLGRYSSHRVLVIDSCYGRSTLCHQYHNILGFLREFLVKSCDGVDVARLRN